MTLFQGLFYYPGCSFTAHDSPLRAGMDLSAQLLSLSPAAAAAAEPAETAQPSTQVSSTTPLLLVYNIISPLHSTGRQYLRQRLFSGAVFSFEHPSSQFPYNREFVVPPQPSQSSSAPSQPPPAMLFAKLRLFDGVLPPDQDQGAGIRVYEENNQVAVGFRSMVERKLADQEALARVGQM